MANKYLSIIIQSLFGMFLTICVGVIFIWIILLFTSNNSYMEAFYVIYEYWPIILVGYMTGVLIDIFDKVKKVNSSES